MVTAFTMQDFSNNTNENRLKSSRNLKFVDHAFEDAITKSTIVGNTIYKSSNNLSINGNEDVAFDISQFNSYNSNKEPQRHMLNVEPETESETVKMIETENQESRFRIIIDNNQTLIVYILVLMLISQYLASTIILFKSATISHFLFITQTFIARNKS